MAVPDYGWLGEERGSKRVGSLRLIAGAVKRGWLAGPEWWRHRRALVAALDGVARDPEASWSEVHLVTAIFYRMSVHNFEGETGGSAVVWRAGSDPFVRSRGGP